MTVSTLAARLTRHNQGVLAFLTKTRVKPPPRGRTALDRSYRAGWQSAKAALEVRNVPAT